MKRYILLLLCLMIRYCYATGTVLRVRVMTYNLRFGELASLEELAADISFQPDFVALQEVDSKTDRKRAPHQRGKDFIS